MFSQIRVLQLNAVCENVPALESALEKNPVDLLFLDIEMPGITGIEFLRKAVNPPVVIFLPHTKNTPWKDLNLAYSITC